MNGSSRRALAAAVACVLTAGPLGAQTMTAPAPVAPMAVPAGLAGTPAVRAGLATALPTGISLAPSGIPLAPSLRIRPAISTIGEKKPSLIPAASPSGARDGRSTLAAAKEALPGLTGQSASQALETFFDGRTVRLAASASDAVPAASPSKADASFERFARAGEQAFYGGRLAEGEHGVVVEAKPKVAPEGDLPDGGEMDRRMRLPTLTNPEREQAGIQLFQLAGAAKEVVTLKPGQTPPFDKSDTVMLQDTGNGTHNIFVVKRGRDPNKVVVVGGHHDKVDVGEGKIDNWGGTTMMANLYQAMKDEPTDATYVFVMFSREEDGLVGSQAFVRSLTPEMRKSIRSMVNVDTVGVDGTFSWKNNSTRSLLELIARVAKDKSLDLREETLWGGDADSSSFKRFTPAITVFGASNDAIWDIVHSRNDNMGAFSIAHYVNSAKLVLELLRALDRENPPRMALWFPPAPASVNGNAASILV